ncbi:major facilitator superfamily domain-containing protein [Diplogelasinospora grovesii]|uniref:Major facilitator superfamily domain-containing protein n=1 Tax=Diplogelasinospora grovesii TaxID=303347 RepID=A0AAN6NIP9_9PEZI|nr:major facilitator superfamily domain-containing protein [Diplogelasinospora grovesii]
MAVDNTDSNKSEAGIEPAPEKEDEIHAVQSDDSSSTNTYQEVHKDLTSHEKGLPHSSSKEEVIEPGTDLEIEQGPPDDSGQEEKGEDLPPLSRHTSTFSRPTAIIIPRSERRGLFGRFAVIPEVGRPYDYKNTTKWMITAVVALAATGAPIGSSIFYPALPEMAIDLNASPTITNLAVALYMLAMSIFPLWWSSFSETLGRRTIYLASFSLFVVFSILSAVSVNISMLIAMRILGGGAAASVQAVGAGTIADIWESRERGRAMGIFYLGPLLGPLFGPIIGGALTQGFGWRSTMWFLSIYGGVMLCMILFGLPETLRRTPTPTPTPITNNPNPNPNPNPQPLTAQALQRATTTTTTTQSVKLRTRKAAAIFTRFFIEPLRVLLYLRFPPVLITVYSAAVAFGSLFILNISIQSTFAKAPYNFSTIAIGLLYLAPSLGYMVASTFGGRWIDRIMAREAQKAGRYDPHTGKLILLPEDRMRENMWLAASVYPFALIWYGWTVGPQVGNNHNIHWIVPCIANFFFGCGSMLVFGAVTTMLTEFMPPNRSSSGVAVNNFVRNIFSCVGGVVAQPLIDALGNGWLCTMIGLFAWTTGNLAIWALKRNGPRWRKTMDQALKA